MKEMSDARHLIAGALLPGFEGHDLPEWLSRRLREGLGGVCLFSTNIGTPDQVRKLASAIREANPNAVIAIDEEGGDVTRLHHATGSPFPGNGILGRIDDLRLTRDIAARVGTELRDTGCTVTFAPDVDTNSNPDNPVIGTRSFGSDAVSVASHSDAWVRGVQSLGIAGCAKHFPGHGDTAQDSHLALPVIERSLEQLRERELLPFRAAIEAGVQTVMTSHILLPLIDPDNPATFSPTILQNVLRDELGFTGVIVTDALDMAGASAVTGIPEAAVRALAAGCDLLCIGTANNDQQIGQILDHVEDALARGRLTAELLMLAAQRRAELEVWGREARARSAVQPFSDLEPADSQCQPGEDLIARAEASFSVIDSSSSFWNSDSGDGATHLVVLEPEPNVAVGRLPWGPLAAMKEANAGGQDPWPGAQTHVVYRGQETVPAMKAEDFVIIVGQNNHRYRSSREFIDTLRKAHTNTLVVDMGWPSPDRAYADIATFGASRLAGDAVIAMLTRRMPAPSLRVAS